MRRVESETDTPTPQAAQPRGTPRLRVSARPGHRLGLRLGQGIISAAVLLWSAVVATAADPEPAVLMLEADAALLAARYDVIIVPRPNARTPRILTERGWRALAPRQRVPRGNAGDMGVRRWNQRDPRQWRDERRPFYRDNRGRDDRHAYPRERDDERGRDRWLMREPYVFAPGDRRDAWRHYRDELADHRRDGNASRRRE